MQTNCRREQINFIQKGYFDVAKKNAVEVSFIFCPGGFEMKKTCAVSVIIPVYNAEKYLGVCLESILIQTFQDYEVIVVDDCSTDASPAIAESFLEKFGGRLKIISTEKNTGSGAVPRNIGLEFSQVKYIFFMDNDDLLIDIALEELYNFAEKYSAEVVYMEKYFDCDEEIIPKNLVPAKWLYADSLIEEPTFESENIFERMEKFLSSKFCWAPWAKFFRRDFLADNKIFLPQMTIADDVIHMFEIYLLGEKNSANTDAALHSPRKYTLDNVERTITRTNDKIPNKPADNRFGVS